MDARELQELIDRLEVLKARQAALIDEQIELTERVAEAVAQNEQAREFQAEQRDQLKRHQEERRQSRRDG